jgi:hypothetical protein
VRSLSELCGLRVSVETYVGTERSCAVQTFPALRPHTAKLGLCTPVHCPRDTHLSGECSTPNEQLKCCSCGGNHTANYRGCSKWKEAKAAHAKQVPNQRSRTSGAAVQPAANRVVTPQPSAEQKSL